jgi:hypothetical protein
MDLPTPEIRNFQLVTDPNPAPKRVATFDVALGPLTITGFQLFTQAGIAWVGIPHSAPKLDRNGCFVFHAGRPLLVPTVIFDTPADRESFSAIVLQEIRRGGLMDKPTPKPPQPPAPPVKSSERLPRKDANFRLRH